MTVIPQTLRMIKGRRLTHEEEDANFSTLQAAFIAGTFERTAAAVGDGVTDDTAQLQSVLTSGKTVVLGSGKSYLITARLNITVAGTGVIGDGTATLVMGSGAGQFDNTNSSGTVRYGTNACGVYATGIARPMVKGVRIKYQNQVDDRYVKALAFDICTDIVCDNNEAWNFTKALGVFAFNDCSRGSISFNHIHGCTTNSASSGQITGIEVDNDHTVGSYGLTIEGNHIHDLTVGASFLTAYGYQTDGINFVGGSATPTHHCVVTNNWVYNVAEGIDCFGSDNIISGNIFDKCYIYGVKLVHSASRNVVSDNSITSAGLGGILLAGSSSVTIDTADNLIQGNRIYKIDPDGAWGASTSYGIAFTANGGTTYLPRRNRVLDNYLDGNSTGKVGVLASASAGTLNEVRGNRAVNFTDRELLLDATVVPYVSAFINGGDTTKAWPYNADGDLLSTDGPNVLATGTLTANRAITLPTENVYEGMRYRITRTGPGAFNLNVGTGPLAALTTNTWCEVLYTSAAWTLVECAPLSVSVSGTMGRHTAWIPASAMTARLTNGSAAGSVETTTNKVVLSTMDFDTTTQEFAQFQIRMPKSWDEGTVTFIPTWSHAATVTNFGVVFALQGVAISNDDVMDVAFGTEQTSTDTGGTTDDCYIGPESSAITIAGTPAAEDLVVFQVKRVPANGSDTLAIDARLMGVTLYFTTNAETDA